MAVGWAVAGRPLASRSREAALFGAVAAAPDLDLLVGMHSSYTHSIGAALLVTLVSLAVLGPSRWPLAVALGAAWGSHVLLDWLGNDTSPPIGIMALWPFRDGYYQSDVHLFDAISRRYWLPNEFVWANLVAAIKEVVILGPCACLGAWTASRRLSSTASS
jgi:hypothetical protein